MSGFDEQVYKPPTGTTINPGGTVAASGWDRAGIAISAACAVHCTLLPVIAGVLSFLGLHHFTNERVEWLIILATASIGVVGHTRAYLRHHQHAGPGLLFVIGLSVVVITRLSGTEGVIEPVALGLGGTFAATAHWMNLRLCRCCDACSAGETLTRWPVDASEP